MNHSCSRRPFTLRRFRCRCARSLHALAHECWKACEPDQSRLVGLSDRLSFWCGPGEGVSPSRVLRIG